MQDEVVGLGDVTDDVELCPPQSVGPRELLGERVAELAARPRDQDPWVSLAERIGDVVLQR